MHYAKPSRAHFRSHQREVNALAAAAEPSVVARGARDNGGGEGGIRDSGDADVACPVRARPVRIRPPGSPSLHRTKTGKAQKHDRYKQCSEAH